MSLPTPDWTFDRLTTWLKKQAKACARSLWRQGYGLHIAKKHPDKGKYGKWQHYYQEICGFSPYTVSMSMRLVLRCPKESDLVGKTQDEVLRFYRLKKDRPLKRTPATKRRHQPDLCNLADQLSAALDQAQTLTPKEKARLSQLREQLGAALNTGLAG